MSKQRRNEQIVELLRDGYSYDRIAALTKLQPRTVKHIVKERDPALYVEKLGKRGPKPNPEAQKELEEQRERRQRGLNAISQRREEIKEYLFSHPELTLQQVGDVWDITRERVRQIANDDPARYTERNNWRRAQLVQKYNDRRAAERSEPKFCVVCGVEITDTQRQKYCCTHHYNIATQWLRYHVDPEYRARQRKMAARWVVNHPEAVTEYQLRHAQRLVDDADDIEYHGRWMTAGSTAMDAALECYENDWPIFKKLPEEVQEQVIRVYESWQS